MLDDVYLAEESCESMDSFDRPCASFVFAFTDPSVGGNPAIFLSAIFFGQRSLFPRVCALEGLCAPDATFLCRSVSLITESLLRSNFCAHSCNIRIIPHVSCNLGQSGYIMDVRPTAGTGSLRVLVRNSYLPAESQRPAPRDCRHLAQQLDIPPQSRSSCYFCFPEYYSAFSFSFQPRCDWCDGSFMFRYRRRRPVDRRPQISRSS